ncbi:MAG TPA: hypothetical protein VIG24_08235 [Acidimicrobiia bacterium]
MQPNYIRGDVILACPFPGGKVRPCVVLRVMSTGGLALAHLGTGDFGRLGYRVDAAFFDRVTWLSASVSVYFVNDNWSPRLIGNLPEETVIELEDTLMDALFDVALDSVSG